MTEPVRFDVVVSDEQRPSTVDETVTYAIVCFWQGRSDACLILLSNTFAADQSTFPKITGEELNLSLQRPKGVLSQSKLRPAAEYTL